MLNTIRTEVSFESLAVALLDAEDIWAHLLEELLHEGTAVHTHTHAIPQGRPTHTRSLSG